MCCQGLHTASLSTNGTGAIPIKCAQHVSRPKFKETTCAAPHSTCAAHIGVSNATSNHERHIGNSAVFCVPAAAIAATIAAATGASAVGLATGRDIHKDDGTSPAHELLAELLARGDRQQRTRLAPSPDALDARGVAIFPGQNGGDALNGVDELAGIVIQHVNAIIHFPEGADPDVPPIIIDPSVVNTHVMRRLNALLPQLCTPRLTLEGAY
mmetsp:Transcript_511/g.1035  ORF Transcript_511/g.1035 Transcript_511/m.1035 type:complete len:212 (-) Transcript_511:973-1608(-)